MQKIFFIQLLIICLGFKAIASNPVKSFTTDALKISIDDKGSVSEITFLLTGKNYLYADTSAPLLTLVSEGKRYTPSSAKWIENTKTIQLKYDEPAVEIDVKVNVKK